MIITVWATTTRHPKESHNDYHFAIARDIGAREGLKGGVESCEGADNDGGVAHLPERRARKGCRHALRGLVENGRAENGGLSKDEANEGAAPAGGRNATGENATREQTSKALAHYWDSAAVVIAQPHTMTQRRALTTD
jgi:hypothetical protein